MNLDFCVPASKFSYSKLEGDILADGDILVSSCGCCDREQSQNSIHDHQ